MAVVTTQGSTVVAAVRAALMADGVFGDRIYRAHPPDGAAYPCASVIDMESGDPTTYDGGLTEWWTRGLSVDVWQEYRKVDPHVVRRAVAALAGTTVLVQGEPCFLRVGGVTEVPEPDTNVAHHAVSLTARHPLALL